MDRAMAEADRLNLPAAPRLATRLRTMIRAEPVMVVRAAIILFMLVSWEVVSQSGLLYRDVVPSLLAIAAAIAKLLSTPDYYWHLWVTASEVGTGLVVGGLSGLLIGLVLGGNRV